MAEYGTIGVQPKKSRVAASAVVEEPTKPISADLHRTAWAISVNNASPIIPQAEQQPQALVWRPLYSIETVGPQMWHPPFVIGGAGRDNMQYQIQLKAVVAPAHQERVKELCRATGLGTSALMRALIENAEVVQVVTTTKRPTASVVVGQPPSTREAVTPCP